MGIENHSLTLCSSNSGPSTKQADAAELKREEKREGKLIGLLYGAKNLAEFQIRRFDGAVRCAECHAEQDARLEWGRSHGMFCRVGHVLDLIASLEDLYLNNGSPVTPASTLVGASAAGGPFRFAVAEGALCECEAECGGRHGVEGCGRRGAAEYIVAGFKQRLCAGCAENALRYCQAQGLGFVDHAPAPIGGAA